MCDHKLGKVESDQYQYCVHCGLGIFNCKHNYDVFDYCYIYDDITDGNKVEYIMQCRECGDIKSYISKGSQ